MNLCKCGEEEITLAVPYRKEAYNVRPVRIHVEDHKRYANDFLFLDKRRGQDYVKKENGTKYGFNVARQIAGLDEGHQGMNADEEIVVYPNGNTLDLRKCNLQVQLVSDKRPTRRAQPVKYGSKEHISTFEKVEARRNSAVELWNQQVVAQNAN